MRDVPMCGSIGEYEHERTEQVNMCRSSASALNSTTLLSEGNETPAIEELLNIESLDDENLVLSTLQESSILFWKADAHPFCDFSQSQHAYRFLYGFIYDADQQLHRLVSDEILAQCGECFLAYRDMRKRLLLSLGAIYDETGVNHLKEEFLKWDLVRVRSGIGSAPSIISASSSGTIDFNVFPNALFELFVDVERLLPLHPLGSCTTLVDEILTHLRALSSTDIQQATRHLVFTYRDIFPPSLLKAWTFQREIIRDIARKATTVIEPEDFVILNDQTICPCPAKFRQVLSGWAAEIQSLCCINKHPAQQSAQQQQSAQWVLGSNLIRNQDACQRIVVILSAVQDLIKATAIPMADIHSAAFNSICNSVLAILQMANSLPLQLRNEASLFLDAITSGLLLIQTLCLSWTPECALFIEPDRKPEEERVGAWLLVFRNLWTPPVWEHLQLVVLQTLREFVYLVSREGLLRSALNIFEAKMNLSGMLELCFSRGQSSSSSTDIEFDERQRNDIRAVKRRLLFLIVALDSQLTSPEDIPNEPPLILRFQIKLSPILQQVLKPGSLTTDDQEIEKVILFSMEKLFDWAVADFKFDITILQTLTIHFCHYVSILLGASGPVRSSNSIPTPPPFRSAFLLNLIPQVIAVFHMRPELGETVIINRLRHLADVSGVGFVLDVLAKLPELENPSTQVLELLVRNGEVKNPGDVVTHEDVSNQLRKLRQGLSDCLKCLHTLTAVGAFSLQCVIDRLLACAQQHDASSDSMNYSSTSSIAMMSSVCLPIMNSLALPGRTSNPTDISKWPSDPTLPVLPHLADSIFDNPLIIVIHQFLPVIVCGRPDRIILSRCSTLGQLLSPAKLPSFERQSFESSSSRVIALRATVLSHPNSDPSLDVGSSIDVSIVNSLAEWLEYGRPQQRIGLLESLDITADVLSDLVSLQSDVEVSLGYPQSDQSMCHNSDPLMGPPVLWMRWLGIMGMLIGPLETLGRTLVENDEDSSEEVEKFSELVTATWRMIVQILSSGPLQLDEAIRNPLALGSRIFHPSSFSTLLLEFLQRWTSSAYGLLELAAGKENTFRPSSPPAVVSVHVEAFAKHSRWVPRLFQWCIMGQADLADKSIAEGITSQEGLLNRWRSSKTGDQVKKLCSNVACAMTIVHKRYQQPMEKGPTSFVSLARGELAPVVIEMLNARRPRTSSFPALENPTLENRNPTTENRNPMMENRDSTLESRGSIHSDQRQKEVRKSLLDYIVVDVSPQSSDTEDSGGPSAPLKASQMSKIQMHRLMGNARNRTSWITTQRKNSKFDFLFHRKNKDSRDFSQKSKCGIFIMRDSQKVGQLKFGGAKHGYYYYTPVP